VVDTVGVDEASCAVVSEEEEAGSSDDDTDDVIDGVTNGARLLGVLDSGPIDVSVAVLESGVRGAGVVAPCTDATQARRKSKLYKDPVHNFNILYLFFFFTTSNLKD